MTCISFVLVFISILYADACPKACKVCTSDGICRACEYGWFGEKCDRNCLASAKICSFCKFNVLVNESICLNCPKGKYFSMGKCWKCFIFCDLCTDYMTCSKCKLGYYGSDCFYRCPENCIECLSQESCTSCKEGWYGRNCQCSKNCVQKGEINDWCGINGTCLNGCFAGKQGSNCNNNCPNKDNCLECDQFSGQCLKCSNALYGSFSHCDKKCGHCQPDTDGVVECNIDTGKCPYACTSGYYGNNCIQECNGNCLDPLLNTNESKCHKTSGHCSFGCVPGWYGDVCECNCSETCRRDICDRKTAQCLHGSDESDSRLNVFPIVVCLVGGFILFISAITTWFIKRRLSRGNCFRRKRSSMVPVISAPFHDETSESVGNSVEIYHMIIDNDHAQEPGSNPSGNGYNENQSGQQVESSATNATVTNSAHSNHLTYLKSVLTSSTDMNERQNCISMADSSIPISRSETYRKHYCDNFGSPLAGQFNETKQYETIWTTHCPCYPTGGDKSRNTALLRTGESEVHDSCNFLENVDGSSSNAYIGSSYIDTTSETDNIGIREININMSGSRTCTCHSICNNVTPNAFSDTLCKYTLVSDPGVNNLNTKNEEHNEIQMEKDHFIYDRNALYLHPVH